MRFLTSGILFYFGISSAIAADGTCIPAAAAYATYFPVGGAVSWVRELTLTAVDIMATAATLPTSAATLQNAISAAYGAGHKLSGLTQNPNLASQATTFPDCLKCLLQYVSDVSLMYTNNTLPNECQSGSTFLVSGNTAPICLYALGPAIARFDSCTGATLNDLGGTPTLLSATGGRCTAQQIMDLDGEFNLFSTVLDKAVYKIPTVEFDSVYQQLPCRGVIDNWLAGFTDTVVNNLKNNGCGTTVNSPQRFTSSCRNLSPGFGVGGSLASYFVTLTNQLGGGFSIPTGLDAGLRCTDDETTILSQIVSFDVLVKCSIVADPSVSAITLKQWTDCVTSYSPILADALVGSTPYNCKSCFVSSTGFARSIFSRNTSGFLNDCPTSSYLAPCVARVSSAGLIDTLYQCSGVDVSLEPTICSASQVVDELSPMMLSVIPAIVLARSVAVDDSSLDTPVARMAATVRALSNLPGFPPTTSNIPCIGCFGKLVVELSSNMSSDTNFMTACNDEYSIGCLGYDIIDASLSRFKACSGFELTKTTSYSCSDDQYKLITDSTIPKTLFDNAVGDFNSTISGVMMLVLNKVTEIELSNNVTLPCANCIQDLVTGFFTIPQQAKDQCFASPLACVQLPDVIPIVNKFTQCSGQPVNPVIFIGSVNQSDSDTNTTLSSTKFGGGLKIATIISVIAAIAMIL